MVVIYRMMDFKTGKRIETESKSVLNKYLKIGYKLITVGWITNKEYLESFIKREQ